MPNSILPGLSKVSVPSATMDYYKKKMLCAQDIETLLKYRDEVMEFFFEGPPPNSNDSNNMRGSILPRKLLTYFEQQGNGLWVIL